MKNPKWLALPVFIVLFAGALLFGGPKGQHTIIAPVNRQDTPVQPIPVEQRSPVVSSGYDEQVIQAYQRRQSDVQVAGSAVVSRILPDDNEGSRHQRFILQLSSGRTLLIAHNIDLAPRINTLREGDLVEFYGEYEWNEKGGVVHWTHHDPGGRHIGGWLRHNGRTYQ